ncbi:transforming acidic coiled-coil-containing protein 3-like [Bufo bufo]|uniref:transforming acidic coiled-coil-containing protein 3-like n=1 Tax=Bufo bufo TaxID=8384 RepID=UPI001ABEBCB7|nr:transforming acidic coiled-coil-containing protein 3-like [Bufo bufo]
MSVQIFDENFGSDLKAETCDFLFTPPGTGRPSILRPSQKDNLPPKSAVKSVKVTFKTPMRDPQTQRIVTPSGANRPESMLTLDDCAQALQQLNLNSSLLNSEDPNITSDPTTLPEDEIPLKSMGAYAIDFDKLDEINPFRSTNKMMNSPVRSEPPTSDINEPQYFDVSASEPPMGDVPEPPAGDVPEPPAGDVPEPPAGDVPEPPAGDVHEPPAFVMVSEPPSGDVPEPPAGDVTISEPPAFVTVPEPPVGDIPEPPAFVTVSEPPVGDVPEPAAGDVPEPPADLALKSLLESSVHAPHSDRAVALLRSSPSNPESPVTVQLGSGSEDTSSKASLDDTVPLAESKPIPEEASNMAAAEDTATINPPEAESVNVDTSGADMVQNSTNVDAETSPPEVPNSPPLPKASYKFDPDQIDAIDPFNTGGSKLPNSPKNPVSENVDNCKDAPLKLEFDFGGGDAAVRKPPPKNLGKRLGVKPLKKPAAPKEAAPEKPKKQDLPKLSEPEEDIIVPKASYNFNWDKFCDPNFNPFGSGGSKMAGSPTVVKPAGDVPGVKKEDSPPKADAGKPVEESSEKAKDDKLVPSENIESEEADLRNPNGPAELQVTCEEVSSCLGRRLITSDAAPCQQEDELKRSCMLNLTESQRATGRRPSRKISWRANDQ